MEIQTQARFDPPWGKQGFAMFVLLTLEFILVQAAGVLRVLFKWQSATSANSLEMLMFLFAIPMPWLTIVILRWQMNKKLGAFRADLENPALIRMWNSVVAVAIMSYGIFCAGLAIGSK